MPEDWYEHLLSFSSSDDLKSYLLNENEQENHNFPNQHRQSATPPTSFTNFKRRRHNISKKLHTIILNWSTDSIDFGAKSGNKITKSVTKQSHSDNDLALLKRGMSPKKIYEVSNFTNFINKRFEVILRNPQNLLIDIGSGLGYLDQFLWYLHGYRVIGIESNPKHIETAEKRSAWITAALETRYKIFYCNLTRNQ